MRRQDRYHNPVRLCPQHYNQTLAALSAYLRQRPQTPQGNDSVLAVTFAGGETR